MAMVRIKRGTHVTKVSKHAYETIFKSKGYTLIGEEKPKTNVPEESIEENETDVEETEKETDIESIPISEMNKEQLMEYAKEHGIDTSSAKNVREARQIIQKAIRESKM